MKKIFAGAAIFTGSFLAFAIQPMTGKALLPVFGGTSAVWTACLCAFQLMLLMGYWYAHIAGGSKWRPVAKIVHILLLAGAAIWAFTVSSNFKALTEWTGTSSFPALGAVAAVVMLVGLASVLLSANASLIQVASGGDYRLYSISNLGSFSGLLVYPFFIEPYLALSGQWAWFGAGIVLYALLVSIVVFNPIRRSLPSPAEVSVSDEGRDSPVSEAETVSPGLTGEWFLLSAASCFTLNAVSVHVASEISPMPMMWAALLAIYLLTWSVAFTVTGSRIGIWLSVPLLPIAVAAAYISGKAAKDSMGLQLSLGAALLLFGCWAIHSRLFATRPSTRFLTKFYLMIALGGAAGGCCASLLVPAVAPFAAEYPIALGASAFLSMLTLARMAEKKLQTFVPRGYMIGVAAALSVWCGMRMLSVSDGTIITQCRNFNGISRVTDRLMVVSGGDNFRSHMFEHNGTVHGYQISLGPWKSQIPTTYYTSEGGGRAIECHPKRKARKPLRVGLAGMGLGVMAAFAKEGDSFRFYEINPQVAEIAQNTNLFSFISASAGDVEIIVDDARRALEKERARRDGLFDVLVVDVFSGDSIPAHMATREAVQLYLDRLAPDGVLAMHLSNWHLDLSPFVKAAAREFGLKLQNLACAGSRYAFPSHWAFLTRTGQIDFMENGKCIPIDDKNVRDIPLMTDDRNSLLPYLKMFH